MQSLKRSLRFRWSSLQMEANLEASDLTATELSPPYLKAFHSLIALDSSSTFLTSWFSFEGAAPAAADPKTIAEDVVEALRSLTGAYLAAVWQLGTG